MNRKDDHLLLAQSLPYAGAFLDFVPPWDELAELTLDAVDTSAVLLGRKIAFPSYINAITGGGRSSKRINTRLARLAKAFDLPMMSGSLRHALETGETEDLKPLRSLDFCIANLGARASKDDMKRACDLLDTDALALHLNILQELLQPEGDRDFRGTIRSIEDGLALFGDRFMVKAVGQGFTHTTLERLRQIGVKTVDISGSGGTNFQTIEALRSGSHHLAYPGCSTETSLHCAVSLGFSTVASGGIETPLSMLAAICHGAITTASAHYYLMLTAKPFEESCARIASDRALFRKMQLACGAKTLDALRGVLRKEDSSCA